MQSGSRLLRRAARRADREADRRAAADVKAGRTTFVCGRCEAERNAVDRGGWLHLWEDETGGLDGGFRYRKPRLVVSLAVCRFCLDREASRFRVG